MRHEQIGTFHLGVDRFEQRTKMRNREPSEVQRQHPRTAQAHPPPGNVRAVFIQRHRREVRATVNTPKRLGGEQGMELVRHDIGDVVTAAA